MIIFKEFFFSLSAVDKCQTSNLGDARDALVNVCIDSLAAYKTTLSSSHAMGALMCPPNMRMLPCYMLALLKNVRIWQNGIPDLSLFFLTKCTRTLQVIGLGNLALPFIWNNAEMPSLPDSQGGSLKMVWFLCESLHKFQCLPDCWTDYSHELYKFDRNLLDSQTDPPWKYIEMVGISE